MPRSGRSGQTGRADQQYRCCRASSLKWGRSARSVGRALELISRSKPGRPTLTSLQEIGAVDRQACGPILGVDSRVSRGNALAPSSAGGKANRTFRQKKADFSLAAKSCSMRSVPSLEVLGEERA